jgi:putative flippase GtrA
LTRQLARFLIVGVSNTALTLAVYAVLVRAGAPPVAASVVAFAAGAVNGFHVNRAWTFRSDRRGLGAGARYLIVAGVGLGLNAIGVALALDVAQLPKLAGELAALPPVTLVTFTLSRAWVFGSAGGTGSRGRAVPRPR